VRGAAPPISSHVTHANLCVAATVSYDDQIVRTDWIKWALIPLVVASALTSIDPEVADAEVTQVVGSVSPGLLPTPLESIHCSSPQTCLAIGQQYAAATSDFGRTWTTRRILHGGAVLWSMACPTSHVCVGVGVSPENTPQYDSVPSRALVLTTTNGGRSWTREPPLARDVGQLDAISCPTTSYCLTVGSSVGGGAGVALVSTNSGRAWRRLNLPKAERPERVTCSTPRACIVAGTNDLVGAPAELKDNGIIATDNGGSTWMHSSLPSSVSKRGVPEIYGLKCTTRTRCFMVGSSYEDLSGEPGAVRYTGFLVESIDGGRTWISSDATSPAGAQEVDQITCESAANCVAVTGGSTIEAVGLFTTSDGARTWFPQALPASVIGLTDISCPSAIACIAVGSGIPIDSREETAAVVETHDSGATWTVEWPTPSQ
jgi:photosystem II stability/assembly factor-like uncharacterized protein